MLLHYISPRYTHEKLEPPFYRDLVDVFEDRMRGWLIEPAKKLLQHEECSVAAVSLAVGYFEGIEIYITGQDSKNQSREFFTRAFFRVFEIDTVDESIKSSLAHAIYSLLRCGFAHDAMFRNGVNFSNLGNKPLIVTWPKVDGEFSRSGNLESVIINPRLFINGIERHFDKYTRDLKRADNSTIKQNFESAIALKWRIGEPGRRVALTESQLLNGGA